MSDTPVYLEYAFTVTPLQPNSDILMAQLGAVGFESFLETDEGVLAYIQAGDAKPDLLFEVPILQEARVRISHNIKEIPQENWNADWERNFEPITVGGRCTVRAPFHEEDGAEYDIVITPKMSFGTGHHETTHMMLQQILDMPMTGTKVLDMGCGTGVLAILAAMRGAVEITAIDIDVWCYENATENVGTNGFPNILVKQGDVGAIDKTALFDVIIANINRNILLKDMEDYTGHLKSGGILLLSGFYTEDSAMIQEKCKELGGRLEKNLVKNNWVSSKYVF